MIRLSNGRNKELRLPKDLEQKKDEYIFETPVSAVSSHLLVDGVLYEVAKENVTSEVIYQEPELAMTFSGVTGKDMIYLIQTEDFHCAISPKAAGISSLETDSGKLMQIVYRHYQYQSAIRRRCGNIPEEARHEMIKLIRPLLSEERKSIRFFQRGCFFAVPREEKTTDLLILVYDAAQKKLCGFCLDATTGKLYESDELALLLTDFDAAKETAVESTLTMDDIHDYNAPFSIAHKLTPDCDNFVQCFEVEWDKKVMMRITGTDDSWMSLRPMLI